MPREGLVIDLLRPCVADRLSQNTIARFAAVPLDGRVKVKVRDSGMPDEAYWESFFDPAKIFKALGFADDVQDIVEFGCGYGTFTIPAASVVARMVYAFDIDPHMVESVRERCESRGISNVHVELRDFLEGTGLPGDFVDVALLFNILHHDDPVSLMKEAHRVLEPGGRLAVIHWNHDPATPRGPALDIRPRPEQCIAWGKAAGFSLSHQVDLPPFHYGLLFRKDKLRQEYRSE